MVRTPELSGMSQYLVDQIAACPNIEVRLETSITAAHGEGHLAGASLTGPEGDEELPLAALFVFIGQQPRTDWLEGTVLRDPGGFVLTGPQLLEDGKRPAGLGPGPRPVPARVEPARHLRGRRRATSVRQADRQRGRRGRHGGAVRAPVPVHPVGGWTDDARGAARDTPLRRAVRDDLERLAAHGDPQTLAPGELLIREGDPGDAMFVVVSGELDVTKRAGTSEQPLARVGPGAIQGELAALQGTTAGLGPGRHRRRGAAHPAAGPAGPALRPRTPRWRSFAR